MIQFNLLPDVKLQYIKAEQTRRLVTLVSIIVSAASIGILLLVFSLNALQTKHLNDLNKDIKSETANIQKQPDLNKVLTIQNQLSSLTNLHSSKPAVSCLASYLNQITPATANINDLTATFNTQNLVITGTTDSLATVNQFIDTLKFTTFTATPTDLPACSTVSTNQPKKDCKLPENATSVQCNPQKATDPKPAFNSVVLTSFALTAHEATYSITFNYDPAIFDITQAIKLTVPKQVTTRSQLNQPKDLFVLPVDTPAAKTKVSP